jgi:hypothetical protein
MIFGYTNECLVMVLCFNVVLSNLRGSEELGWVACMGFLELLGAVTRNEGRFLDVGAGLCRLSPILASYEQCSLRQAFTLSLSQFFLSIGTNNHTYPVGLW